MDQHEHTAPQKSNAYSPLFAIVLASVEEFEGRACENQVRVGEIQTAIRKRANAFGFIPGEFPASED